MSELFTRTYFPYKFFQQNEIVTCQTQKKTAKSNQKKGPNATSNLKNIELTVITFWMWQHNPTKDRV